MKFKNQETQSQYEALLAEQEKLNEEKKKLESQRLELSEKIGSLQDKIGELKRKEVITKIESYSPEQKDFILSLLKHNHKGEEYSCDYGYSYYKEYWGCPKCMLTEIFNGEHGGDFDFQFEVEIFKTT